MLIISKVGWWLNQYTTPHHAIMGDVSRQRAQLYVLLCLVGMVSALTAFGFLMLLNPSPIMTWVTIIGSPLAIITYLLSRTRFVKAAMIATMVINYGWVSITISLSPHPDHAVFLLIIPMVFVSLLFSTRATVLATFVSISLSVPLGMTNSGLTFELMLAVALMLVSAIGIVTTSIVRESDQQKLALRAEALARSEARYRALFKSSPIPLSEEDFSALYPAAQRLQSQDVHDIEAYLLAHPEVVEEIFRQLEVIEVNPATLSLYRANAFEDFIPYFAPKYFERNPSGLAGSLVAMWRGDLEHTYEAVDYTLDGEAFECRIRWVRLSDIPLRIVVSIEDLTPIKQAERQQQALAVERSRADMLQRFLGDTTHDLLTPITIMNTSIYLGLRAHALDQVHERLRIIQTQTTNLHTMIMDMLTMSRLDDPNTTFHFRIGDLTQEIARIVSEFEPLAQTKQQQIRFQPVQGTFPVRYDEQMMGRALKNLIQNALKYTPEGGTITLHTRLADRQFEIDVSDNGVGIPPDELQHVFDRFYRVEAHRPIDGGSGLGLAIVKKIVDAHDGEIDASSTPSGGATFTLRLPLA